MARKVKQAQTQQAPPQSGADDLSTIHPDASITVGGRDVLVREYGFVEGMRVRAFMKPFTADLDRLFGTADVLVDEIMEVVGEHIDIVKKAIAQSIAAPGKDASPEDIAWLGSLDDQDGDRLLITWWGVNGLFFVRSIVRRAAERARRATLNKAIEDAQRKDLAGETSMPPLSQRDTEIQSGLVDTRSGS
jgi:hypothetical protein